MVKRPSDNWSILQDLEESAQSASCDGKLYVCQLLDHSLNIKQQLVFLLIPFGSY